ncbi:HAD family hydrolase [Pseudonocardia sp. N23]|uniref:HAD family hydrolase n=1 Tax=Pseudonocardia sp. N23 TaxID=1987376 RepID=UPI000BFDE61C|nr:HAD hydrolase-like protein [Pseudonocardia sp. N23]
MSAPPVQAVIFDLDGTLVQTRIASWEVFEKINRRFALGVDEPERYFDLFRGNIYDSIAKLCRDDVHAAQVREEFLRLLRREYTPPLVPGVADVVRRLASTSTLAVMSSNAMEVLRRVLTTNDLAFCFAHVFGGDVTPDKRTAIRTFLADPGSGFGRRCAADYDEAGLRPLPDPAATVLVTDTAGDVRDGLEVGIRVVGVAWGMHSVEELTEAGAEFVALWPQEITAHLLGGAAADPATGACAVTPVSGDGRHGDHRHSRGDEDDGGRARAAEVRRGRRRSAAARPAPAQEPAPARHGDPATAPPGLDPVRAPTPGPVAHRPDGRAARAAGVADAELLDAVRRVARR